MKILVMSCDKDKDIFEAFYRCMEKNWKGHPEVIYATESVENPYYRTIRKNYPLEKWTRRIRETLEEIEEEKVMIINDDCFIREEVDKEGIERVAEAIEGKVAMVNLEESWDKEDEETGKEGIKKRRKRKFI